MVTLSRSGPPGLGIMETRATLCDRNMVYLAGCIQVRSLKSKVCEVCTAVWYGSLYGASIKGVERTNWDDDFNMQTLNM